MKIGDEVYIHGYVDEIRQNVVIIRNDGGYFGTVAEEITSRSEIPNTCGDAISREELIEALDTWDKFGYAPTNELIPLRGNVDKDKYVPYIHYDDVIECIKGMPSVTQQPCDDAISRKAVMDCLKKWQPYMATRLWDFEQELLELPSVTPQQRTGRWMKTPKAVMGEGYMWYCDNCEHQVYQDSSRPYPSEKYCPECGIKMEVEE